MTEFPRAVTFIEVDEKTVGAAMKVEVTPTRDSISGSHEEPLTSQWWNTALP